MTRLADCARDSSVELVISVDANAGAPDLSAQSWLITCMEVLREFDRRLGQLSVTRPPTLTIPRPHSPWSGRPPPDGTFPQRGLGAARLHRRQGEYGGWMQVGLTWPQPAAGDSAPVGGQRVG